MHVFYIFFLMYSTIIISIRADDELKYIDLLPEKEKQDFLGKIARRILEEVETKDEQPKESREIPKEELDMHDAFVHKLLKEESENLKKPVNNTIAIENGTGAFDSNTPVLRKEKENKGQFNVDLTLRAVNSRQKRENNRRVFTVFGTDSDNSTEHDKGGKESEIDIQVKNFRRITNTKETHDVEDKNIQNEDRIEKITVHKNQSNEINAITINNVKQEGNAQKNVTILEEYLNNSENLDNNDTKKLETTTSNIDKLYETESTTHGIAKEEEDQNVYKNQDLIQESETTVEKYDKNSENLIEITTNNVDRFYETESTSYDNSESTTLGTSENLSVNVSKITENIKGIEETEMLRSTKRPEKETKLPLGYEKAINQGKSPINEIKNSDIIKIEIAKLKTDKIVSSNDKQNTKNVISNNDKSNEKENSGYVKYVQTTPRIELLTSAPILVERSNVEDYLQNSNMTGSKLNISDASITFLSDMLKSIKQSKIVSSKKLEDKKYHKKLQEYKVYEIDPDVQPFIKSKLSKEIYSEKQTSKNQQTHTGFIGNKQYRPQPQNTNKLNKIKLLKQLLGNSELIKKEELDTMITEEPYYAPIYNYAPKNAFYNPHNVFGPNSEDEDQGYSFPSIQPEAENIYGRTDNLETKNQPFHVPIYNYSPKNANYNPHNKFGPNSEDNNLKLEENDLHDDNGYDFEKYDDTNESEIKHRDQIESQYLYDPLIKNIEQIRLKKLHKVLNDTPVFDNLIGDVKKLILKEDDDMDNKYGQDKLAKDVKQILGDDLDWTSNKEREFLRCRYKQKCGMYVSKERNSNEKGIQNDDLDLNGEFLSNTMSKVRHMLLEKGHFMLAQAGNTSKLESVFSSAENADVTEKDSEETKNKLKNSIRASLLSDEDTHRKKRLSPNSNENIAIDYYERINNYKTNTIAKPTRDFDIKKFETDMLKQIHNHVKETTKHDIKLQAINLKSDKTDPLKLIYIKNTKENADNPAIRTKNDKTSYDEIEYKFIKDLSEMLHDEGIYKLYYQLNSSTQERKTNDQNIDIFAEVLGDMIQEKNRGLDRYDWLMTTVELQSAIRKLMYLVEAVQNDEDIHPLDLELLKYVVHLYNLARDEIEENSLSRSLRGMKIPRGRNRHRSNNIIKESGLLYRAWLVRLRPKAIPEDHLRHLASFLLQLQDHFRSLHTALKYIAIVTNFKNQKWFENLKQIHFDYNKKQYLEVILHLTTSRLFGLIEESAKNGLEDDFLVYMKKNIREVEETKEEFVFVLKVLDLLNEYY